MTLAHPARPWTGLQGSIHHPGRRLAVGHGSGRSADSLAAALIDCNSAGRSPLLADVGRDADRDLHVRDLGAAAFVRIRWHPASLSCRRE
jgi:hypothetical protein